MNLISGRKKRAKRSIIWKTSKEEFAKRVAAAATFCALLSTFGLESKGGNNETVKRRCVEEGIDFSHIRQGCGHNKGRKFPNTGLSKEQTLQRVFIIHETAYSGPSRSSIKRYLIKYNLIPYVCPCGNCGEWQGKKLSLQIDHVNGECNDHRLENLRWMCPNCHSQTPTFTGKHKKRKPKKVWRRDIEPGWRKNPRPHCRKFQQPSKEELEKMIWSRPMTEIQQHFGMGSINSVKRWCRSLGVNIPPQGYWLRRKNGWSHEDAIKPTKVSGPLPSTFFTCEEAEIIRKRLKNEKTNSRKLAKEYGCSHSTIDAVRDNPNYGSQWAKENHLLPTDVNVKHISL